MFRFRYASFDLNVGAVLGEDEVLVVDTRSWVAEAIELLADLRGLTRLPCRQVVNTHWHFDHCFGNATLRPAAIWGHERCVQRLRRDGEPWRSQLMGAYPDVAEELAAVVLDPPDRPVGDAGTDLQVGGRRVELRFCGAATPTTTWSWSCPTPGWCSPATWSRKAPRRRTATTRSPLSGRPPSTACSPWPRRSWFPAMAT